MSTDSERDEKFKANQTAPAAEPATDPAIASPAKPSEDPVPENAAARIRIMTGADLEAEAKEIELSLTRAKAANLNRFQKGVSANPRGRPRKVERSYTPRQQRRDILQIAESQTTIRTSKSKRKVPIIEAIIRVNAAKALAGHGPSINRMMKWYSDAVKNHTEAHAEFEFLESMEVKALTLDEMTEYWNNYLAEPAGGPGNELVRHSLPVHGSALRAFRGDAGRNASSDRICDVLGLIDADDGTGLREVPAESGIERD